MAIEDYLLSLGAGTGEQGHFTILAERARELLAGKSLTDPWQAWLCLAQGFLNHDATALMVSSSTVEATWVVNLPQTTPLIKLLSDERFLLGWANLDWFGQPSWNEDASKLVVRLKGHLWARYRFSAVFSKMMVSSMAYANAFVKIGPTETDQRYLISLEPISLYPLPQNHSGGITFANAQIGNSALQERRRFTLPDSDPDDPNMTGSTFAAVVYKTKDSWSQVRWISHGVLISTERNTLERPGISVVASVQGLKLKTDLSGFAVINDDMYHQFIRKLKRDILWML